MEVQIFSLPDEAGIIYQPRRAEKLGWWCRRKVVGRWTGTCGSLVRRAFLPPNLGAHYVTIGTADHLTSCKGRCDGHTPSQASLYTAPVIILVVYQIVWWCCSDIVYKCYYIKKPKIQDFSLNKFQSNRSSWSLNVWINICLNILKVTYLLTLFMYLSVCSLTPHC